MHNSVIIVSRTETSMGDLLKAKYIIEPVTTDRPPLFSLHFLFSLHLHIMFCITSYHTSHILHAPSGFREGLINPFIGTRHEYCCIQRPWGLEVFDFSLTTGGLGIYM